jgi:hypothetical protein
MPVKQQVVYQRRRVAALLVILGLIVGIAVVVRALGVAGNGSSPAPQRPAAADTSNSGGATVTLPPPPAPFPGYLLIADRGNNRLLLVDGAKHILWHYPHGKPSYPFRFDDDAFFSHDFSQIITNQEEQHTLEILSFPEGQVVWHYGHPNVKGSSPGYLNSPDDAYLLPSSIRTVADAYNCRVLFISPAKKIVRQVGTTGVCGHNPPSFLGAPNGDTPYSGGRMLITEITGSWVDAIGPHNKVLWTVQAPVAYPSDAQWLGHGRILLADYSAPGHLVIMTKTGRVLWRYGPASGPGALDHPSLALKLPNGLIAVNDDYNDRVVVIDPAKNRIVWQYGVNKHPGTSAGLLNTPDGMDFLPYTVAQRVPAIRRMLLRAHH